MHISPPNRSGILRRRLAGLFFEHGREIVDIVVTHGFGDLGEVQFSLFDEPLGGTDTQVDEIGNDTASAAREFAGKHALCCVLKSHNTAVNDKGARAYVNTTGNSGMATGGSGDVLAGVIASLLAQKHLSLSVFDAATLGVYLHADAGDRAAEALGKSTVMARDIANNIRFQ